MAEPGRRPDWFKVVGVVALLTGGLAMLGGVALFVAGLWVAG